MPRAAQAVRAPLQTEHFQKITGAFDYADAITAAPGESPDLNDRA